VVFLALQAGGASAQARHALIIGNAEYQQAGQLANTIADAEAYADVFDELGYDVTLLSNLDRNGMEYALADFYDGILPGDTAVFVFSGHGWSDGAVNYILPTDIRLENSERRVKLMSTPLQNGVNGIIDQIRDAGAAVQVAIIDACRDNIFASQGGTRSVGMKRGLAIERAPQGAFMIFSAGAGEQALDGLPGDGPEQRLSVFTRHFLPRLKAGLYLEDAINDAQMATAQDARSFGGHLQNPAYYDQINGKLCLADSCGGAAPVNKQPQTQPQTVSVTPCSEARAVWQDIRGAASQAALEQYIADFRSCGTYRALAEDELAMLQQEAEGGHEPLPVPDDYVPQAEWVVILGSFPHSAEGKAHDLAGRARNWGLSAQVIDTGYFGNLRDGLFAVVLAAGSKEEAARLLPSARGLVSDAYIKKAH
jgi:hypothetical protein